MNEHIFDVLLEEALGGAQPPDLSDRIVARLMERRSDGEKERQREGVKERQSESLRGTRPAPRPIIVPAAQPAAAPDLSVPLSLRPSVAPSLRPSLLNEGPAVAETSVSQRSRTWLPLALAASLLIAVGAYWTVHRSPDAVTAVADQENHVKAPVVLTEPVPTGPVPTDPVLVEPGSGQVDHASKPVVEPPRVAETSAGGDQPPPSDRAPSNQAPSSQTPSSQALADSVAPNKAKPADEADAPAPRNSVAAASLENALENALSSSASTDTDVIASINAALAGRWKEASVRPSPAATESEWCRRVYLDSIGRIPTVEELEAFLIDNRRDKRSRLVEKLLEDDHYVESYARFWTTLWTNLLIGRTGGMEPNSPVSREGLEQYLRRSFLANKPYNRLVYELISAQGANRPGAQDYN
ncbi:MAG: DUF1549 domain-containing protein, partial [Pirellulales bacterium]